MINLMQLLQMGPMINQFMQNPMQALISRGIDIPPEYMNTPETAAKYLVQNSGMNQNQINQIMDLAEQYQNRMKQGMVQFPFGGIQNGNNGGWGFRR
jgi:hypothetical protein